MEIISIKEAKAEGSKWYFTGKPCVNGHVDKRTTSNNTCHSCSKSSCKKYRDDDPKRHSDSNKAWYNKVKLDPVFKEKFKQQRDLSYRSMSPSDRAKKGWNSYGNLTGLREYPENSLCECCGNPETVKTKEGILKWLSLDHDHVTLEFRGWICQRCNHLAGKSVKQIDVICDVKSYLEAFYAR
jgi:hypothetical protein